MVDERGERRQLRPRPARRLRAALTSSSRLSTRVWPFSPFSARWKGISPLCSITVWTIRCSGCSSTRRARVSISSMKRVQRAGGAAGQQLFWPTAWCSARHSDSCWPRATSRRISTVFSPMPRVGRLTTRSSAASSSRRRDQAQVGHGVLDLGALEEALAAIDRGRECVRAAAPLPAPATGRWSGRGWRISAALETVLAHASPGCGSTTKRASSYSLKAAYRRIGSPSAAVGPQLLAQAPGVVGDQRVGGLEDVGGGAVVLLQADGLGAGEVAAGTAGCSRSRAPRQP